MESEKAEPTQEGNDAAGDNSASTAEAPAESGAPDVAAPAEGGPEVSPDAAASEPDATGAGEGDVAAEAEGAAGGAEPTADGAGQEVAGDAVSTVADEEAATPPPPALVPEREPPHIEAVNPAHGPLRGGTRLDITGVRFTEGCLVRIGDTDVDVTFESETHIAVTTPERASFGYVDVRVTNPDGKNEVRVHGFQYDIPPLPEFVKPDTLGLRGGSVRVFGEAFAEGIVVSVGGLPVPVVYKGEDCLEVNIPGGDPGAVELTLTNPDGQSAVLAGKLRLAEGPVIEGVSPACGLPLGGTRVTITGRNFARGCTVTLFGKLAPAVTYEGEKKLTFVTPAHEAGVGAVRVTNADGLTTVIENAFEYRAAPPPIVTQVSPDRAWVTGGSRLLVSGGDFAPGCTATIAGRDAPAKWKNGGLLEIIVPAGGEVGPAEVVVANPDGQTATSAFTYERVPTPPKLIAVTPSRGPTHGGVTVVLTGDNFDEETVVRIAEVRTTTKVLSRTEMEVLVPPRPKEGPVAIELVSGEGVAVRSEDVFYYNDQPPPRITGVAPNQGPMSGNTRVSLEGEGFSQDCWVRIGRERPKTTTIKGTQLIEIVTPPCKITGFVDIEVGTNQTGSTVAKNVFRFVALPPPVVDSVAPNRGATSGGTEMSITGKHFNAECIVTINGKQVKFKLISSDLIECRTPPGNDGHMADVSVKNPDGKESVVRRAFAYDARYKA